MVSILIYTGYASVLLVCVGLLIYLAETFTGKNHDKFH
jgi:hypothetical protein